MRGKSKEKEKEIRPREWKLFSFFFLFFFGKLNRFSPNSIFEHFHRREREFRFL